MKDAAQTPDPIDPHDAKIARLRHSSKNSATAANARPLHSLAPFPSPSQKTRTKQRWQLRHASGFSRDPLLNAWNGCHSTAHTKR